MSSPIANKVILPLDTGNTGKNIRTQTRVVGADTVHEHFFVPISARSKLGIYFTDSGLQTVQAAAQNGTSTGFLWLINPIGSTVKISLKRVDIDFQISAASAFLTNPRIAFSLFTFTGTPSGAAITPAKRDSTDSAAQGSLRSAMTGLTIALGQIAFAMLPPVVMTAVGYAEPFESTWAPFNEEDWIVLRPGEGVVCYQPEAGTSLDTRKLLIDLVWEEFE